MPEYYDFKQFRTPDHLRSAMITYCQGRKTEKGIRGNCPRVGCNVRRRGTLRTSKNCRVAYCPMCDRSFDAIEIVRLSRECTHAEACYELASVIVNA